MRPETRQIRVLNPVNCVKTYSYDPFPINEAACRPVAAIFHFYPISKSLFIFAEKYRPFFEGCP